jgi:hypothetical protein
MFGFYAVYMRAFLDFRIDVLETLTDLSVPVLASHVPSLVTLMLAICSTSRVDIGIRAKASGFLCVMMDRHKQQICKSKLVSDFMQCGLVLATERFDDEQFEASQMTPQKIAFGLHCQIPLIFSHMLSLTRLFANQTFTQR